jgi:hypothetical protein
LDQWLLLKLAIDLLRALELNINLDLLVVDLDIDLEPLLLMLVVEQLDQWALLQRVMNQPWLPALLPLPVRTLPFPLP